MLISTFSDPVTAIAPEDLTSYNSAAVHTKTVCGSDLYVQHTDDVYNFLCESNTIPLDFFIYGLNIGETCTLQVESTIAISHNLNTQAVYSEENNHIVFQIHVREAATKQSVDSFYLINYEYITLTITTNAAPAQICTVELYIINSQHGLFVSIVNEEAVYRYMIKTLCEANLIDIDTYEAAIVSTYSDIPDALSEKQETIGLLSARSTSSLAGTTVRVDYDILVPSAGKLTVQGTVYWTDTSGDSIPARGITVLIMDEEDGPNETLGSAVTSNNGTFSCTVNNQPSDQGGSCDVFCSFAQKQVMMRIQMFTLHPL